METVSQIAGIGLRRGHYQPFRAQRPQVGFVEVHAENFFNPHDPAAAMLMAVREDYAVSLHGVGLALGSACDVDQEHLNRLASLVERLDPVLVSEHACCARVPVSGYGVVHANDLLPIAFTRDSLDVLCANVQRVQERLGRPLLLENLSTYINFAEQTFSEPEFFSELGRRTGCGMVLDINNLMVNALNTGERDPLRSVCGWLDELACKAPEGMVGEIHLAGHSTQHGLIIDDHSAPISARVWQAFAHAISRFGPVPTLIEWDDRLPPLDALVGEASQAAAIAGRAALQSPVDGYPPGKHDSPQMSDAETSLVAREANRQRALLAKVLDLETPLQNRALELREAGERQKAGLAVYRRNIVGHISRALKVQFPTVRAMLGQGAFEAVCARYCRDRPPTRGDLAWVGEDFAAYLAQQGDLEPWPWLTDSARLDWALWRVLFEAPARFGTADLERLTNEDPVDLFLLLAPGTRLLRSRWPVVTLKALHATPDVETSAIEQALQSPGEIAWVWRQGWESDCCVLTQADAHWLTILGDTPNLDQTLEAAPPEFDFRRWLHQAVERGWLDRIVSARSGSDGT